MTFDTSGRAAPAPGVCGEHTDGDLDSIFSNWQYLAAVAWRGYQTLGCGAVVVNVAAERADVSYAGGALPENYTRFIERYDPLEQLVIVVRHATGEHVYLLSGRPSPRDCAEAAAGPPLYANVYVPSRTVMQ